MSDEELAEKVRAFFDAEAAYSRHVARERQPDEEPDFGPWLAMREAKAALAAAVGYGYIEDQRSVSSEPNTTRGRRMR